MIAFLQQTNFSPLHQAMKVMMEQTGRTYAGLIDELIRLAIERREEEASLRVNA